MGRLPIDGHIILHVKLKEVAPPGLVHDVFVDGQASELQAVATSIGCAVTGDDYERFSVGETLAEKELREVPSLVRGGEFWANVQQDLRQMFRFNPRTLFDDHASQLSFDLAEHELRFARSVTTHPELEAIVAPRHMVSVKR
jgi:hypothetical protein